MDRQEGDALILAAIAIGGVALLWVLFKVARVVLRLAGTVSTALTVIGALLWLREQFQQQQPEEEPV